MVESHVKVKKNWFIRTKNDKIEDNYKFDIKKDKLGEGTYGNVIKGYTKEGNNPRAIKVIPKSKVKNPERFKLEIEIMRHLDHPNIMKLYETFEDPRHVYLVMDLCTGGELFDRIIDKGRLSEAEARNVFLQIMRALFYCHSNKICHRDLKPENFLLLDKSEEAPIKVIDFGLSVMFEYDKDGNKVHMDTKAGTPYYIAPEVLAGKYDEQCDIWSAGVILYILLCGYPPFYGNNDNQILSAVKKGKFDFDGAEWKAVSESAKDLIKKMLCPVAERLKAGEVLEHPWFKENLKEEATLPVNFSSLKNFRNSEKLKKATLTYIATQCSDAEIGELGKVFHSLDKNGDGVLTIEELKGGLEEFHVSAEKAHDILQIFKSIDTDGSGTINYTEFLAATMEKSVYLKEEKLWAAFKMFDKDGNGKISADELKEVLGSEELDHDMEYWAHMIQEADVDGDGEIDYNEFIQMMSTHKE